MQTLFDSVCRAGKSCSEGVPFICVSLLTAIAPCRSLCGALAGLMAGCGWAGCASKSLMAADPETAHTHRMGPPSFSPLLVALAGRW